MSIPIITDEWLFSDICGESGLALQEQAIQFLLRVLQVCDKIVIVRRSPFEEKIYKLFKISARNLRLKAFSQFFKTAIFANSLKATFVNIECLPQLPNKLLEIVPRDDWYLIQAHLKISNSIIITTDGKLKDRLSNYKFIKIYIRDSFIRDYLHRELK